jgi:hypothetical protein
VVTPQNTPNSVERRRHVRQKANSIVCVKLDHDNGGILLNLSTGGLSFQAVAKLSPDQTINIQFKLPDSAEEIQLRGSVAWLGPTCKQAGISFAELSENEQQRISEWIAKQGAPSDPPGLSAASTVRPPVTASETLFPAPRVSVPMASLQDMIPEPGPNSSTTLPARSLSADALPDFEASGPNDAPTFHIFKPGSIPTPTIRTEEHLDASLMDSNVLSQERFQPIFEPNMPDQSESSQEIPRKEGPPQALPGWFSSIVAASKGRVLRIGQTLSLPAAKRNRKKLILAGLAIYFSGLGLVVISRYHRYHLKIIGSTAASDRDFPSLQKADANDTPAVGIAPRQQPQVLASLPVPSGSLIPRTPVSAPPKRARQATVSQWEEMLKKVIFGVDDTEASDQVLNGLSVWTYTRSGYYFCADSPYFGKLQPGSIMAQGDALQSGYQPKLGSKCR